VSRDKCKVDIQVIEGKKGDKMTPSFTRHRAIPTGSKGSLSRRKRIWRITNPFKMVAI
jgi:hypothetical protein